MHGRDYAGDGATIVVLHGGPAAPGSAALLARGLSGRFRVLEPWQRGSGGAPLTVKTHIEDLAALLERLGERPALVGESWGAMLALAFAAEYPERVGPLALVGCGTFDEGARAELRRRIDERTGPELRELLERIDATVADPAERLLRRVAACGVLYDVDPVDEEPDPERPPFDLAAHEETWADMLRLQAEGVFPSAFRGIRSAVLMLHGADDPHPGALVRDGLRRFLPQLEYREWERCGHRPWVERAVREEFFAVLGDWLDESTEAASKLQ